MIKYNSHICFARAHNLTSSITEKNFDKLILLSYLMGKKLTNAFFCEITF